jgi:ABC-2 family transporter protein
VPALALLLAPLIAAQPFVVGDKAALATLHAVLPVPRRAVLLGHYGWALVSYFATVAVGTTLAVLLAWVEGAPFDGRTLVTLLTLSWALFAVNTAVQFPLLIRFGYARINVLATIVPAALVMVSVLRLHLTLASIQAWLPLLWPAGAAAIGTSAALTAHSPRPWA